MPQIPVLNGVYADQAADFRTSYPRNMVPVPKATGIAAGYLRPAEGIVAFGTGIGEDRGAINWRDECYRVSGRYLVKVAADGTTTNLADVGIGGQVTFDYSFDRLAIASGGRLYYWNGTVISQVTDPDLGTVVDMLWVDGYFMTTDGVSLIVTELNDPTSVNPLRYGSSEADPDGVKALIKVRNEPHALNRYTIEVFDNVGGDEFPFARIEGAQVQKGALGTSCCAVFMESLAFLGSGRNEAPAIWAAANGNAVKLSTREIDQVLLGYTEAQLALSVMESRVDKGHQHLMLHLPDRCLVYDGAASAVVQEPVWFTLTSSLSGVGVYRARNFVWCYDKWLCGDPVTIGLGTLDSTVSTHYGANVGWQFETLMVYNKANGGVVHDLELVGLPGRVAAGLDPVVWTSYSNDGQTWSQEQPARVGRLGERNQRMAWRRQGQIRHYRVQRFRGTSESRISVAALEAEIEPLQKRPFGG